jgi:hypothetical protein
LAGAGGKPGNFPAKCGPTDSAIFFGDTIMKTRGSIFIAFIFFCVAACAAAAPVQIVSPAKEDVVRNNSGDVAIQVEIDESLLKGRAESGARSIRILLDGNKAAEGSGPTFALSGVERGGHTLQAVLVDASGQSLSVSDPVAFTMAQASVNAPPLRKK